MSIGKKIGRKLSVKEMGFDKPAIQKLVIGEHDKEHFLCRFYGSVTGLKPYKIKEGERAGEIAFGLMGQFAGESADGEVKDGSILYLPGYVNDAIVSIFSSNDDISSVKIAYDIYATYDETSATSYTFSVNDLLNVGSESVSEVKDSIKALPLPSAVKAIENKSK